MTNEQLATLVKEGQTEYTLPLWQGVERFASAEARRWARSWQRPDDVQDLQQCAFLALLDAVKGYDPARGKFLTWYSLFLKKSFSEALDVRGRPDPLQGAVSFDTPVADGLTVADTLPGDGGLDGVDRKIFLSQLHNALEAELEQLPDDEAEILRASFYGRESVKAIASERGLSEYKARSLKERGLNDLRKPRAARRLEQFIDGQIDPYRRMGIHGVESLLIYKGDLTEHYLKGGEKDDESDKERG